MTKSKKDTFWEAEEFILNFHRFVDPVQELYELLCKQKGKRTEKEHET